MFEMNDKKKKSQHNMNNIWYKLENSFWDIDYDFSIMTEYYKKFKKLLKMFSSCNNACFVLMFQRL